MSKLVRPRRFEGSAYAVSASVIFTSKLAAPCTTGQPSLHHAIRPQQTSQLPGRIAPDEGAALTKDTIL